MQIHSARAVALSLINFLNPSNVRRNHLFRGVILRVLNIDLDFFLNDIAYFVHDKKRLNSNEYRPWSETELRFFLEHNCGLSKAVHGKIIVHHHEAFPFWRSLIEKNQLNYPFELVHIDGHADLGLGDDAWVYIVTELLNKEPSERWYPKKEKLRFGNYLSFAIACRWISDFTFVTHHKWEGRDLMSVHFEDFDPRKGFLQMKKYRKEDIGFNLPEKTPLNYEPKIPFQCIDYRDFTSDGDFDYIVLSQSPGYTPKESDKLISIFKEYIIEI